MPDVLNRPAGHVVPAEERQPIVTNWDGPDDYDNAPPSYDEFYRQYRSYTYHLVSCFGFYGELDDVVSEIMIRFMERDSLGVFRRDWTTRSETGTSVFRSYYSRFVVRYASGKKRGIAMRWKRYRLICDYRPDFRSGCPSEVSWIEHNAPTEEFESSLVDDLEFQKLMQRVFSQVDESLYEAAFGLAELAMEHDSPRRVGARTLARKLGISDGQAEKLLAQLRPAIARAVEPDSDDCLSRADCGKVFKS